MKAVLTYLGRMVSLSPACLGEQFEGPFTVQYTRQEPASEANRWQARTIGEESRLWWYDTSPKGEDVFVTMSGYGYRILSTLQQQGIEVEVRDLTPSGLPPRPDFSRLAPSTTWRGSQREVFCKLLANRCGVISCPTGWGKSFLIRQIARVYPSAYIGVTVPSVDVAEDLFRAISMDEPQNVGIVGGGKNRKRRITIAVTHSLDRLHPEINLLLVDEVHGVLTANFLKKFNLFTRARFQGFTATPTGRSDSRDGFLEPYFGPIIHHVPYQEAVDTGNVVPLIYRVYQCSCGPRTTGYTNKARRDREAIWRNPSRNALVVNAVRAAEAEYGPDAQILVMVSVAEHAFILQQHLPEYEVVSGEIDESREQTLRDNGAMLGHQKGVTKDERRAAKAAFSSGRLKRAIATFVWSKGVDFLDLSVLVRADGLATPIGSGQIPGRLSRKGSDGNKPHGLLIDFNDAFCPILMKRSKSRFDVYAANGWQYEHGA